MLYKTKVGYQSLHVLGLAVWANYIITVICVGEKIKSILANNTFILVYRHAILLIKSQTKNVHHNTLIVNQKNLFLIIPNLFFGRQEKKNDYNNPYETHRNL